MSKETSIWLNNNTLIGQTDKRGEAWHYRAEDQGDESNHYPGFIPVDDVYRRLFHWDPVTCALRARAEILTADGVQIIDIVDNTRQVIIRPDIETVLGVFKEGYQPHPYRETLVHLTQEVVGHGVGIGSAGLLRGGGVAWVQFEFNDTVSHAGVDFRPFVTAATSLDGTLASQWVAGSQVVVCDNTLSCAIGDKSALKISKKHTKYSLQEEAWSEIRDALRITLAETEERFTRQVEILTNEKVTDADWGKFLTQHFGEVPEADGRGKTRAVNRNNALTAMWHNDPRVAPWNGSAYGVLAAVNTFTHHEITPRAGSRVDTNMWRAVKGEIDTMDNEVIDSLNMVFKANRRKAIQFV